MLTQETSTWKHALSPGLEWEWEVFRHGRESAEHGTARSLEDAKAQAAKRAEVEEGTIIWKDIGTTICQ